MKKIIKLENIIKLSYFLLIMTWLILAGLGY